MVWDWIVEVEMDQNICLDSLKYLCFFLFSGNGMRSGIFFSQKGSNLKKVPNQQIFKGDNFCYHGNITMPVVQ